jgi:hypothetical protein
MTIIHMTTALHNYRLVFYSSAPRIRHPGRPNTTRNEKMGSAKNFKKRYKETRT